MENSTPCQILIFENFMLKLGPPDYVGVANILAQV